MGLSSEERIVKFFWATMAWRRLLYLLAEALHGRGMGNRDLKDDQVAKIVDGWVARLDHIIGRMIVKANFTGAYWLFGSNDDSFKELCGNHHGLANYSKPEDGEQRVLIDRTPHYGSLKYWQAMGFAELAKKLSSGKFSQLYHDEMVTCGMWWDQFRYVDSILYPVDRYQDGLFSSIRDDMVQLLGEMTARRLDIQKHNEGLSDRTEFTDNAMVEQALLCKHKVLMHLLDDAEKQLDPPLKQKGRKLNKREHAKWRKCYEGLYTEHFDIGPLIEQAGTMSLAEVETFLEQRAHEEYERKNKLHHEQNEEDEKKKYPFSGLTGPVARTEEELEHIIHTTTDGQEYEKAYKEREHVYNTTSGFATWTSVLKDYPKAAKIGYWAAYEEVEEKRRNTRKRRFVGTVPAGKLVQVVKDVRKLCKGMGLKEAKDMVQGKAWVILNEKTRKAVIKKLEQYGLKVEWADKK